MFTHHLKVKHLMHAVLLIGLLLLLLCEQKSHQQSTHTEVSQSDSEQVETDPINSTLDQEFYGQDGDIIVDGSANDDEMPKEADSALSDENSQDLNAKLIEDLGFILADEDQTLESIKDMSKLYCLDSGQLSAITIKQACDRISKRLASVSMDNCLAANLIETGCSSVQNFPILVSEFSEVEGRTPQGRILLIGGTHGDELTSVSMTFRWIEKLNKFHSGLFKWRLIPMMNPDGVLKRGAERTNHNGVDLNRNLPSDDWENTALKYWETKVGKNPRRYPGERAASEPETQWLIDEINQFKPDAIISIHAPYGVVDFDSLILGSAPKNLGKLHLNLLGTYPGSLGNYAGINRNIPVITLELPNAWEMPSEKDSTKIWEDIVSWLKKNIKSDDRG